MGARRRTASIPPMRLLHQFDALPDVWLTTVAGRPTYRVSSPGADCDDLSADLVTAMAGPSFLWAKFTDADASLGSRLESVGFRHVETWVTFARESREDATRTLVPDGCTLGWATGSDRDDTVAFARAVEIPSRFTVDGAIPRHVAPAVREAWVDGFFNGTRGDAMVIVRCQDEVVGFLQIVDRNRVLSIDLIAVDAWMRKRDLASAMITFAGTRLPSERMEVGTMAANVGAMALYAKLGFVESGRGTTLHRIEPVWA